MTPSVRQLVGHLETCQACRKGQQGTMLESIQVPIAPQMRSEHVPGHISKVLMEKN